VAVIQFSEACHIRPDDTTANNALGAVLLASDGFPSDPASEHRAQRATRLFGAHYNLGMP